MGNSRRYGLWNATLAFAGVVAVFSANSGFGDASTVAAGFNGAVASGNAAAASNGFGPLANFQPSALTPVLPPSTGCMGIQGMPGQGTQAFSQIDQLFGTIFSQKKTGKDAKNAAALGRQTSAVCDPSGAVPYSDTKLTCDLFSGPSGYDPKAADAFVASLQNMDNQIGTTCKAALTAVSSQISCIQSLEQQLQTNLNLFSQAYTAQVGALKQWVSTQKLAQQDVQDQIDLISKTLGGDQDPGGSKGLLDAQARIMKSIYGTTGGSSGNSDDVPVTYGDVLTWQQKHDAIVQRHAANDAKLAKYAVAQINQCLTTVQPSASNLRCPGDPTTPVSPLKYLQCSYQRINTADGGQYERNNQFANTQGQSSLASLNVSLMSLLSNTPTDTSFAMSPQADAIQSAQHYQALTVNDVRGRFISQFAQYGSMGGMSVQDYMGKWYDYCNSAVAQPAVQAVENDPSSDIGTLLFQQQEDEKTDKSEFQRLTQGFAQEWQRDNNEVFGVSNPANLLNGAHCNDPNTPPNQCFANIRASMQQLLNSAPVPVNIPAKFSGAEPTGTQVAVPNCNGITNCISSLRNLRTERQQFQKSLATNMKQTISQVNSTLNNTLQQSASNLSTTNQAIRVELQGIGKALSALHVQASLKPGNVDSDTLKTDDDGIPDLNGTNLMGVISGKMPKPGLVDLSDSYDSINNAVADAGNKLGEKSTKVERVIAEAKNKEAECAVSGQVKLVGLDISRFKAQCSNGRNLDACQRNDTEGTLGALANTLSAKVLGISNAQEVAQSSGDTLSGLVSNCKDTLTGYQKAQADVDTYKNALTNCPSVCLPGGKPAASSSCNDSLKDVGLNFNDACQAPFDRMNQAQAVVDKLNPQTSTANDACVAAYEKLQKDNTLLTGDGSSGKSRSGGATGDDDGG